MTESRVTSDVAINMEFDDIHFSAFGKWIETGGFAMRLNLDNAKRLRDAAAEVVLALSPLPDFGAFAQAEAAPDPLQWAPYGSRMEGLYRDGVLVAAHNGVGDNAVGPVAVRSYGRDSNTELVTLDRAAARRVCIEIAEGTR